VLFGFSLFDWISCLCVIVDDGDVLLAEYIEVEVKVLAFI